MSLLKRMAYTRDIFKKYRFNMDCCPAGHTYTGTVENLCVVTFFPTATHRLVELSENTSSVLCYIHF